MFGGAKTLAPKPNALVCYICGREYGTASLKIHQPQCKKLWLRREKLKPKHARLPLPTDPMLAASSAGDGSPMTAKQMTEYNEQAYKTFTEKSLQACPNCGRTFFEDRLKIHLRSCQPGKQSKRLVKGSGLAGGGLAQSGLKVSKPGSSAKRSGMSGRSRKFSNPSPTSGSGSGSSASASASGSGSYDYDGAAASGGGGGNTGYSLVACGSCGRKFAPDRISKHENVCKGPAKKKQAKYQPPPPSQLKKAGKDGKDGAWKNKHSEFQEAMQYAKKMRKIQKEGGDLTSLPPPKPAANPDYVQCPHCNRRFNETAANRHIPKCATTINKPKPPPHLRVPGGSNGGGGGGSSSSSSSGPRRSPSRSGSRRSPSRSPGRSPSRSPARSSGRSPARSPARGSGPSPSSSGSSRRSKPKPAAPVNVDGWLANGSLDHLCEVFASAGFDDLDLLKDLDGSEQKEMFSELGVKLADQFKLKRMIKDL